MTYFEAAEGDSIDLTFNNILGDGTITVSAKVYSGTTLLSTESLSHVADGFYRVSYTIPTGYSKLAVFYIPSGSDNANAIDNIKVRSLSSFGGAGSVVVDGGGISADDIKKIVKELNVWGFKLPSGRTAAQELMFKSEFNPSKEKVITDLKLEKVDLSPIQRNIDEKFLSFQNIASKLIPLVSSVNSVVNKLDKVKEFPDVSPQISEVSSTIKDAKKSINLLTAEVEMARDLLSKIENPNFDGVEKLILDADEMNLKRTQAMVLSILGALKRISDNLEQKTGDFTSASRELKGISNQLKSFSLQKLQDEMA